MILRFANLLVLLVGLFLHLADARAGGPLNAIYNSATDLPLTSNGGYDTNGISVNFTLSFAPPTGTNLTVVKVINPAAQVNGTFVNLAQNQAVALTFNGYVYNFVANYYGGSGNDARFGLRSLHLHRAFPSRDARTEDRRAPHRQ